jgi:hypothetical protein
MCMCVCVCSSSALALALSLCNPPLFHSPLLLHSLSLSLHSLPLSYSSPLPSALFSRSSASSSPFFHSLHFLISMSSESLLNSLASLTRTHMCLSTLLQSTRVPSLCQQVRGRHREGLLGPMWDRLPAELCTDMFWESVPTQVGDLLFFDSFVPHRSGHNLTEESRRLLYVTYNRLCEGDARAQFFQYKRVNFPTDMDREALQQIGSSSSGSGSGSGSSGESGSSSECESTGESSCSSSSGSGSVSASGGSEALSSSASGSETEEQDCGSCTTGGGKSSETH